jgi:cell wall assembly regulator SMI1
VAQVDKATAPLGLRLPVEARTLFGWHDGTMSVPGVSGDIGPAFALGRLEKRVEQCWEMRRRAAHVAPAGVTGLWEDTWFPLMPGIIDASIIVIDTDTAEGDTAAVGLPDKEGTIAPIAERTFTDIVEMWVNCMDTGLYTWSPEHRLWTKPWPMKTLPAHLTDFYI